MKIWNKCIVIAVLIVYSGFNIYSTNSSSGGDVLDEYLTYGYNDLFAAAGECNQCHGKDPNGIANVTAEGLDVNQVDGWRSTMMANSAKDPFWRAKVSHEVAINPDLQTEIESSCVDCHAPLGYFEAVHNGENYSIEDLSTDSIGLDGVSCVACHQQSPEGLTSEFSGGLIFADTTVAYGPYESPLISTMAEATGYIPEYSPHIQQGGLCASCHTLITETVDLEGNLTGNDFVEQATYHEWLNSIYGEDQDNVTCQNCHMPAIQEEIIIAANNEGLSGRSPFYIHELVGGNVHMLQILKDHIDQLGLNAQEEHFDKTIQDTYNMLQQGALDLDLELNYRTEDTAFFDLKLSNLAGHKFPSGYPARRLFIKFEVFDEEGNSIFLSGETDEDHYLINEDLPYEPHHDMINSENEVQIYEMVMGDVNGDFTTILTRANAPLKDNRLVPVGFSTSHITYDTTLIAGQALIDPNFNNVDGVEGSGSDHLQFHIPLAGYTGELAIQATAYYQPIPPKWMEEMFELETVPILDFKEMFENANNDPILVETESLDVGSYVSLNEMEEKSIEMFFYNGKLQLDNDFKLGLTIYDIQGKLLYSQDINPGLRTIELKLPKGVYIANVEFLEGHSQSMKFCVSY